MPTDIIRVLHVEDEPSWREEIAEIFDGLPVEVVSVGSLTAAREALANEGPFDAVICDGNLISGSDHQGHDLALELHRAGQEVAVLASHSLHDEVPFFDKGRIVPSNLVEWVIAP